MPRNTGGIFTLPNTPFVSGTPILAYPMNEKFQDIGLALTESLSRTGAGGMLAPLVVPDGSAAAPTLTWANDVGSGFYLNAPGDVRLVSAAATLQRWTLTAVEVNRPLTVTATTSNSTAVTATGNGTGAGGSFTGGATGLGVTASGGIFGTAAAVDTNGMAMPTRYGFTHAAIPTANGATYPMASLLKTAAAGNTVAMNSRIRTVATVTDFTSVELGVSGEVDGVVGALGQMWFGRAGFILNGAQTASAATPQKALTLTNGYLDMATPANPNSNVAFTDTLTPRNFDKVTAAIQISAAGAVTLLSGFNVSSTTPPAIVGGVLRITFASSFADANYEVTVSPDAGATGANMFIPGWRNKTATTVEIQGFQVGGGAAITFGTAQYRFDVRISGAQ